MARPPSVHRQSIAYGRLFKNLIRLLDASCSQSFYEVIPKGVQVWLPSEQRGLYPDLCIIAGEPLFHDGHAHKITNPCLVVEILPERTAIYDPTARTLNDRSQLFRHCRKIPYLQEYIFVHQQEVRIEQFHRQEENLWTLAVYEEINTVVELNLTDTRLPLMEVYNKVGAG
ncbi:MAG: Uma2 family endonuclease [Cyanobacteria bacterium REEB459]|nr:Uma2 family endonuclease [Cyanobacteria bacterium REEB459]